MFRQLAVCRACGESFRHHHFYVSQSGVYEAGVTREGQSSGPSDSPSFTSPFSRCPAFQPPASLRGDQGVAELIYSIKTNTHEQNGCEKQMQMEKYNTVPAEVKGNPC